ncbi:MAG: DNA helicase UvrD [Gammaproteobacteria bacterium]|nr:MAG: DNA helicase UvrD [Gammaproteobacteria bacterium]
MNDQKQRNQALDISQSFIIQAPAGSGKTELLTQRYLKLLAHCVEPESVIAMTFTNKAVDEMTHRVLSALKSTVQLRPSEPHKQTTYDLAAAAMRHSDEQGWQLLQNPKRLKISTIDGLYSLITNRYPLPDQLVPRQIMAQQWERSKAYQTAAQQTLMLVDDEEYGKDIQNLLLHLDNNVSKFENLVVQMLSKRDQWLGRLYRDNVLDLQILQDSARTIVKQYFEYLQPLAKVYLDDEFFGLLSAREGKLYALPTTDFSDLGAWQAIADLCLTKKGTWRKAVNKLKENLSEQKALGEALQGLGSLPDIDFSQAQAGILQTIAQVLKLSVAQLNIYFEAQQAYDFIEVALNANQALDSQIGVSDIALFMDYKVQHLLIDEFQDTSASQFNTVEKLIEHWQVGDGKTLFLVGDPMQSIYRFRESQVGLFLQVRDKGIANIRPTSLVLNTNFRSSKSIVEGNNGFFSKIFPEHEDVHKGAISYSSSLANSDAENDNAIVFYPFAHDQYLREAKTIGTIVTDSLAQNPQNTIAILVRGRAHLLHIAQQLTDEKIAFESVDITELKDHLLTRDLLSLSKALLHLGDKLSWLSVLRAPWCGLILDDLLVLSEDDNQIIYKQLNDEAILEKMSADGRERAQHLYQCLQEVISNQGRFNFVELLTHAMNQLGLKNETLAKTELAIKDKFLQIIYECEQQQLLSADTIEQMIEKLYAPSEKAQVKLMTVHASKGLEFDTVIIPGLGRSSGRDDSPIIRLREFSNKDLLLAPMKSASATQESGVYRYLKSIETEQNYYESMRLLYVAMTRAKSHLHLLGAVNKSGNIGKNTLLELLGQFFTHRFDDIDKTPDTVESAEILQLARVSELKTPVNRMQEKGEMVEYQQNFERLFKRALGTLVHQYYEHQLFDPSAENIRNQLISIGTPPSEIEKWQAVIIKLLNNTKNDAQFEWLFKDRASARNEAEFSINGSTIAIDRLFIDEGTLWVIDFKTAKPAEDEPLEAFIKRQQQEHTKQLQFYKTAMSEIYDYPVRCALYCPSVKQLIEIS